MFGRYNSPHLIRYNERVTINNEEITDKEMSDILEEIDVKAKEYTRIKHVPVKEFEIITTLALIYFARKKCDFAVLETGLGGTYDCTNIVPAMISIITSIGYDHMDILGNTIEEITANKAGIIKKDKDTITLYQDKITDLIAEKCEKENNKLHIVKKEDVTNYSFDEEYQKINYKEHKNIYVNLKGECQIYNAAIAMECANLLKQKGYPISKEAIREGLKTVIHKARFEQIGEHPTIIFDGGHNENAIKNLRNTINMYYKEKPKVYILSILKRKDYKTVIKILSEDKNAIFFFTSGNNPETYVDKEELYNEASKYLKDNLYKEDLLDAIKIAKEKYKDCTVFVIGSFYVYADVMKNLEK